jgi:high-affinity iron transporter
MQRIPTLVLAIALLGSASLAQADAASADVNVGKQKYDQLCATCHGPTGAGDGPAGKALNPPARNLQAGDFKYGGTDQDLFDVISNGAASKGGSPLMAPWGSILSEQDRWAVVKYIRTLKK